MKKIIVALLMFIPVLLYGQNIISTTPPVWMVQSKRISVISGASASVGLSSLRRNSVIIVAVTWSGVPRPLSITDKYNHTFNTIRAKYDSTTLVRGLAIAYAKVVTTGIDTIRVNFSAVVTNLNVIVMEYGGLDLTNTLIDTASIGLTTGDPATTGTLPVKWSADLFVAAFTTNAAFVSTLDTFKLVDSARTLFVESRVFRTYSQVPARLDISASSRYLAIGVAFRRKIITQTDTSFVTVTWRKNQLVPNGYRFSNYWLSLSKDGKPLLWSSLLINDTVAWFRLPPAPAGYMSMYRLTIATVAVSTDTAAYKPYSRISKTQNILWQRTNASVPMAPNDSILPTISVRYSNPSTAALVLGDSMELFEKIFYYDTDTIGSSLFKVATIYPRDTTINFRKFIHGKKYKFYARTWYSGITLMGDTIPLPALTIILGNKQ